MIIVPLIVTIVVLLVSLSSLSSAKETASSPSSLSRYGVDASFPMHYKNLRKTDQLSGDRQEFYERFMAGCQEHAGKRKAERCLWGEEERLEMNIKQPREMHNHTSAGFAKMKAPPEVTKLLQDFWETHKNSQERERWPKGSIHVNHWEAVSYMAHVDDELKEQISRLVQPVLEAWSDQSLITTSVYGVRIYQDGSILSPHVDRLPLVTSCILNVAQDVDEDWPLEVIGHDGVAYNITSEPGDMILYESHSIIHGRPFAMKGRYYANIFIHFEPFHYTEKHALRGAWSVDEEVLEDLEKVYANAQERYLQDEDNDDDDRSSRQHKDSDDVPHYVDPEKADQWRQEYVYQPDRRLPKGATVSNPLEPEGMSAHTAAALGKIDVLKKMHERDPTILTKADDNGWRPIHEAARSGETETIQYLVSQGAKVNERTNNGKGATPLFWAEQMLDEDHPTIKYLKEQGAVNQKPQRAGEKNGEL